jgi:hypothetical protein
MSASVTCRTDLSRRVLTFLRQRKLVDIFELWLRVRLVRFVRHERPSLSKTRLRDKSSLVRPVRREVPSLVMLLLPDKSRVRKLDRESNDQSVILEFRLSRSFVREVRRERPSLEMVSIVERSKDKMGSILLNLFSVRSDAVRLSL